MGIEWKENKGEDWLERAKICKDGKDLM